MLSIKLLALFNKPLLAPFSHAFISIVELTNTKKESTWNIVLATSPLGCLLDALFSKWTPCFYPNTLGILAGNLPESSKIFQGTFGNCCNFASFEEVKVSDTMFPISNSADFFPQKVPLGGL